MIGCIASASLLMMIFLFCFVYHCRYQSEETDNDTVFPKRSSHSNYDIHEGAVMAFENLNYPHVQNTKM